jgi:hypothetical protein
MTRHTALAISALLTAALSIGGAVLLAPAAVASANEPFDTPGVALDAHEGTPCGSARTRYVYGLSHDASATYVCMSLPQGSAPKWVVSLPLSGVRNIGEQCIRGWVAQAPDGRPMICDDYMGHPRYVVSTDNLG